MPRQRLLILLILTAAFRANGAIAQMPPAIAAPGEATVATLHAELDFGLFMRREPGHFPFGSRYGAEFSYCLGSAGT
jgi:hypothetical protein